MEINGGYYWEGRVPGTSFLPCIRGLRLMENQPWVCTAGRRGEPMVHVFEPDESAWTGSPESTREKRFASPPMAARSGISCVTRAESRLRN